MRGQLLVALLAGCTAPSSSSFVTQVTIVRHRHEGASTVLGHQGDALYFVRRTSDAEQALSRLDLTPERSQDLVTFASVDVPEQAVIDSDAIYWSACVIGGGASGVDGAIRSVPLSGGPITVVTTIAFGCPASVALAIDDANVYWFDAATHRINAVAKHVGTPSEVALTAPEVFVVSLDVDAQNIYWTGWTSLPDDSNAKNDGVVEMQSLKGGAGVAVASAQSFPTHVRVVGATVYWMNLGSTKLASPASLMRSTAIDNTQTVFVASTAADGPSTPHAISVDGDDVYFLLPDAIRRARTAAGNVEPPLVTTSNGMIDGLALDATSIYWYRLGTTSLASAIFSQLK